MCVYIYIYIYVCVCVCVCVCIGVHPKALPMYTPSPHNPPFGLILDSTDWTYRDSRQDAL